MKIIVLFLLVFGFLIEAQWVRRAAFDIGSGATKMVVADVNAQNGQIKVIYDQSDKVDYQMAIEKHGKFDQATCDRGVAVLARLKWAAIKKGATQFVGVATSAFRKAKNAKEYTEFLQKVLEIKIYIISQKQEAILGFLGAIVGEQGDRENYVVWDIGGGSMQMLTVNKDSYVIYEGKLASVSFANYIIEKIHGKSLKKVHSPNPLTRKGYSKAIVYARLEARKVPKEISNKFLDKKTKVLGIGGVHYYSIRGQVKMQDEYGRDGLYEALYYRCNKDDKQIGGKYASTEVSNLALVVGFMEELKIKSVRPKKVTMANGLLLYNVFWQ